MKRAISTQQTQANIATIMDLLAETPKRLERLSATLSSEQLRRSLGAGERSPTETLAHLVNCEERSAQAIYLALLLDAPYLPDIHPERQWGKLLRHDLCDFADLLAYFRFRRRVLLPVLTALTQDQWARVVREEGKQRQESVYWQARGLALHELAHLTDLEAKLA